MICDNNTRYSHTQSTLCRQTTDVKRKASERKVVSALLEYGTEAEGIAIEVKGTWLGKSGKNVAV
jgi:hypothetical protein